MTKVDATEEISEDYRTIAVVGVSASPEKASYKVAQCLIERGYQVYLVNPTESEIMGRKSYPDLASIPEPVSVVDIFRRPDQVVPVVDEAIAIGAKAVWLQPGAANEAAAARAKAAGLLVVMDRCICNAPGRLTEEPEGGARGRGNGDDR